MDQILEPTPPINNPSPPETTPPKPTPKPNHLLPILLTFFITSALFIGSYFGYQYIQQQQPDSTTMPSPAETVIEEDSTTNWQTHTLQNYQFKLPPEFTIDSQTDNIITAQSNQTEGLNFYFDLGAGVGFQCIEKIETNSVIALGKTISIEIYQGVVADPTSACQTDTTNHYVLMTKLSDSNTDPQEILVIAFDSPQYSLDKAKNLLSQILSTFRFSSPDKNDEVSRKMCGGIANIPCPDSYRCKLDGNYPDASGICVKQ